MGLFFSRRINFLPFVVCLLILIGVGIFIKQKYIEMNNSQTSNAKNNPLCKDCNIIILHLDTLNANHLPCYGYSRNTAPNLCQLGKNNIIFKNFYSNAPWTLPSTVSILTSLYPEYHGVNIFGDKLSPKITFLPEILQHNGYETYFYLPTKTPPLPLDDVYNRGITKIISDGYGPLSYLDGALNSFLGNVKQGKKTFSYIQTYYIHAPYFVDNETLYTKEHYKNIPSTQEEYEKVFYSMNLKKYLLTQEKLPTASKDPKFYIQLRKANSPNEVKQLVSNQNDEWLKTIKYLYYGYLLESPAQVEYAKALYDQKINELDKWIGNSLMPFMDNPDIKNNTIVILTADHGEEFMEHKKIFHETLYDSNVKVPFMVYIPGLTNKTIDDLAQSVDIVPTVLDMVGIPQREFLFQGISLVDLIKGNTNTRRFLYADGFGKSNKTVRNGNLKLFLLKDGDQYIPTELYDTKTDPNENDNIIKEHSDIVDSMMSEYNIYGKKWRQLLLDFVK